MIQHSWNVGYEEARSLQSRLRSELRFTSKRKNFRYVAGADVAFTAAGKEVLAVVVVLEASNRRVVDESLAVVETRFPYIPGLLSFREAPAVLEAWKGLQVKPEALMVDGQGLAHPRRFGLACHLGLWLKLPSVGCAKSRLIGTYQEPGCSAGSWSELCHEGEQVGAVLRTRNNTRPVFVSAGYLLPLDRCIALTLDWCQGFRIPEPTRQAHLRVTSLRRERQSRAGTTPAPSQ